jgi:thiamine-phosphate pyrophosphorylase
MPPFRLCLVAAPAPGRDLAEIARRAVTGGVDAVQVRGKELGGRALHDLAARVIAAVGDRARVLVNDRVDVALALGAAGVHLPGSGLPVAEARRLVGPERIVGRSVHSEDEARAAEAEGADYLIFGPVFATESKRAYGPPQGLDQLRRVAAAVRVPVCAIGGITPERAGAVRDAGAAGMAVLSFILDHPEPEKAARTLIEAWNQGVQV